MAADLPGAGGGGGAVTVCHESCMCVDMVLIRELRLTVPCCLDEALLPAGSGRECSFELTERLSWLRICQGLAGAGLFLWAPQLVHSMAFRLGTGSLTFAMLSLLILLFLVARYVLVEKVKKEKKTPLQTGNETNRETNQWCNLTWGLPSWCTAWLSAWARAA